MSMPRSCAALVSVLSFVLSSSACDARPHRPAAPATGPTARNPMDEKLTDAELRARKQALPRDQYHVTQEEGTEPPFRNAWWNNHAPGIYVDVVSGEPLFSSKEKFDSGTGWPSFWQPLDAR